ncbi:hypothetical protein AB0G05_39865 [Nonomuraea wenchangensis]
MQDLQEKYDALELRVAALERVAAGNMAALSPPPGCTAEQRREWFDRLESILGRRIERALFG